MTPNSVDIIETPRCNFKGDGVKLIYFPRTISGKPNFLHKIMAKKKKK